MWLWVSVDVEQFYSARQLILWLSEIVRVLRLAAGQEVVAQPLVGLHGTPRELGVDGR